MSVNTHLIGEEDNYEEEISKLIKYLEEICLPHGSITVEELVDLSNEEIIEKLLCS